MRFFVKDTHNITVQNKKIWGGWRQDLHRMIEHCLEVPNLYWSKPYKIGNNIANFQKLNLEKEAYLTLVSLVYIAW